ncbi:ABC transporter permease [Nocardiopsis coralliicola]
MPAALTRTVIVVALVAGYEAATRLQLLDPFTFVPLTDIVLRLSADLADPEFRALHLVPTLAQVTGAFALSTAAGIAFGVLLWRSDLLHHAVQPYLLLLYAIPSFVLYPVFISVLGMGSAAVILAAALSAVPAVVLNTALGFRQTRSSLVKVGRAYRLSARRMLVYVLFPAAWPQIFTGLRLAAVYSIIGVIATQFILSAQGIGFNVSYQYNNFDLDGMYASILLILAFAIAITTALRYVEGRLRT